MPELKENPQHIAIIMDGNGRWAKSKGMPRMLGHREGVKALRRAMDAAQELDIKHLTFFGFSTENWNRPKAEVDGLMRLLKTHLIKEKKIAVKNNTKIIIFGDKSAFSKEIQTAMHEIESATKDCTARIFNLAVNYGGKEDITQACKTIAKKVANGELNPEEITQEMIQSNLYSADQPPVDLMIRTSYEHRISNFMLWQLSYSELVFLKIHWPEFQKEDLEYAINVYKGRERRFGAITEEGETQYVK